MVAPAFSIAAAGEIHSQLPLERLCSSQATVFQLGFARQALARLADRDGLACEPTSAGLLIRSETEAALEQPVDLLREIYGEDLHVGPLTIRCRETAQGLTEPHMGVQVRCQPADLQRVRGDLERRGARIVEAHAEAAIGVVRATAPLARLIGYAGELAALTGDRAYPVMWLSHYESAPPAGPPGGAAA